MTSLKQIVALLAAGMVCLATVSVPLAAQQRRVEQLYTADGIRLDFPPDGVWRVKARRVSDARARLLSQGRFAELNAPAIAGSPLPAPTAVTGTLFMPTILVGFSNTNTASLPDTADYDSVFYLTTPLAGRPYTLRTFYQEMSKVGSGASLFSVQGQTFGWRTAANDQAYYLDACGVNADPMGCATGLTRLRELLTGGIAAVDGSLNFGLYDNDGPDGNPNSGDDDGVVDVVQFVQPVIGRECPGGPGYNAHKFSLSGLGGGAYTTNDARTPSGSITINSYYIVAGVGGINCTTSSQIQAIGTSAHELGHGLGLPDLYDTNPLDVDDSEGIGEWGLMGGAGYTSLISPGHHEAWSKARLGWVVLRQLTANGRYSLGPVVTGDTVMLIRPLGPNPRNEYFLLENKQALGSDTANMLHGPRPKGGGLAIWHVDSTKVAVWPASNTVNTGSPHGLTLAQADGLNELSMASGSGGDRGDAGDPYPGSTNNKRFSYNTNPANVKNSDGTFAGFEIDSVTQDAPLGSMTFKLAFGGPTIVRASDTLAQVSVDGTKYQRFAQLLNPGTTHTIVIDSAQVTTDGLRQFVFQSWSDAGARSHDITGQLAGDSISAAVSTRFRVRATTSGGGTITSYPAGNVTSGVYVLKDSTFSLKATPSSGKIFGGWSGDTTSSADSIRLTVSKPYTLTAAFFDQLAASAGTPAAPVMGKSYSHTLTATGGTGTYSWQVASGALPDGLSLGTGGAITGIPSKTGSFSATARVTSGSQTADVTVALTVTAPALITADVISHILGTRQPLSADDLKYLDLLGNNSGGFDVGDFLAWVNATGAQAPEIAAALASLTPAGPPPTSAVKGRDKP